MIGASAVAGAVGAGGLGDVAIRYGYQRFDTTVMAGGDRDPDRPRLLRATHGRHRGAEAPRTMTSAAKQIRLNAFNMNCVGHINHGLWTHPRDRSSEYNTLRYWTDQAKLLERGLFDGLFIADILGVYDIYGGGIDVTAREAVQLPVNDPTLIVPAMAAVTEHLGFGITVNVFAVAPLHLARRISTLDHLTGGRVG